MALGFEAVANVVLDWDGVYVRSEFPGGGFTMTVPVIGDCSATWAEHFETHAQDDSPHPRGSWGSPRASWPRSDHDIAVLDIDGEASVAPRRAYLEQLVDSTNRSAAEAEALASNVSGGEPSRAERAAEAERMIRQLRNSPGS